MEQKVDSEEARWRLFAWTAHKPKQESIPCRGVGRNFIPIRLLLKRTLLAILGDVLTVHKSGTTRQHTKENHNHEE
jgi:hypothetical protein